MAPMVRSGAGGLAALVLLASLAWLARLERGGPPHADLELEGGIPARLYLPGGELPFAVPEEPAPAERPPGVVVCHGFGADRNTMSTLARRLARSGYAVLAIDARGHGENRNAFVAPGRADHLKLEFTAAVDFLRSLPRVDGLRIAVMGHSMGAGAALDYATRDSGLDAAVLISGGWRLEGPYRPPNALFVYAERDPERVRAAATALAGALAESVEGDARGPAGGFAEGTAVRAVEIPGHDHVTILWSTEAAQEIVTWLDSSFGVVRRDAPDLDDPRLPAATLAFLAFLVTTFWLGSLVGRLAPDWPTAPARGSPARLGAVAVALVVPLPLASGPVATAFLAQPVSREVTQLFLVAGSILLVGMALRGGLGLPVGAPAWLRSLGAALVAWLAVAAALTPMGVVIHGLAPTPERALLALVQSMLLLPLFLALELLLRRGSPLSGGLVAAIGRLLLVAVLAVGVATGLLPRVLFLQLPLLVGLLLLMEILAGAIYLTSRNRLAIAVVQAAWLGWIQAATMPVGF